MLSVISKFQFKPVFTLLSLFTVLSQMFQTVFTLHIDLRNLYIVCLQRIHTTQLSQGFHTSQGFPTVFTVRSQNFHSNCIHIAFIQVFTMLPQFVHSSYRDFIPCLQCVYIIILENVSFYTGFIGVLSKTCICVFWALIWLVNMSTVLSEVEVL